MTRKILFILLAALVCIMLFSIGTVSATNLYVNDTGGYPTISNAVSAANDGDTIIVSDGLYVEWVYVSTSNLTICSENGSDTTSWTGIASDALSIDGVSNVTIDGFKFYGGASAVIEITNSNNCTISNNLITTSSTGILVSFSQSNTILNNVITDNNYGIQLVGLSNDNTLIGNTIYENTYGIYDSGTYITNLISNTVLNNTEYDVFFSVPSANKIITDMILTNNSSRISTIIPASIDTSTYFKGLETSTAFPEMTNINGYISINRTSDVDLDASFSYDESDLDSVAESDISLYWLNDTTWTAVEGATLDTTNNKVSATLTGFSENVYVTFGLFADTIIIPSAPEGFTNTTGDDWINHTWTADTSGKTDSYNISIGESWINGSTYNFFNHSGLSAHAWSNITVYAYNATDSTLSDGTIDNVQMPNNVVTILDITDITVTEGETITFDINSSDADGDTPTFACNNTSLFDSFNTETGEGSWITDLTDAGIYSVEFNVTDGYGSISSQIITITVNDFTLSAPTLSNSTGNFYVDWTWDAVENADSYNVSLNGIWTNGTTVLEMNNTPMDAHATSTIQVLAYNETYGALSDAVSDSITLANNLISISGLDNIEVNESELISVNAGYSDLDEDTPTFSCNRTDLFTDFNTSTGEGTWQTNYTSSGTYSIEFTVSDGVESTATQVITITVTNAPTTFYVGSSGYDYTTIQDAINDAAEGDTIIVTDGIYAECIIINKGIVLRSENGAENTTLLEGEPAPIINIYADNVTIDGFNVTGSGTYEGISLSSSNDSIIINNTCTVNSFGIYLDHSNNITVTDNILNNNINAGILTSYSSYNTLTNNEINNNGNDGIYLHTSSYNTLTDNFVNYNEGTGIYLDNSCNNNTIEHNRVHDNYDIGILVSDSDNNILTDNNIYNNYDGITLSYSNTNTLTDNILDNNDEFGIYLIYSNTNTLANNIAVNNDVYGIAISTSINNILTDNIVTSNILGDFWTASLNNTVENLEITLNGILISYTSDDTATNFIGNYLISTLSEKINVGNYFTIERSTPLEIFLSYDDSDMSSTGESSINLYKYNNSDSTWSVVNDTTLNISVNQLNVTISEGTYGLFKDPEPTTSSSSSSSGSSGGSVATRVRSQGTIATLSTNGAGELTGDTVVKSKDTITTVTLYKGTVGTDTSGNPVNTIIVTTPASMPADTPDEVLESGLYYDFGPSGTTFNKEVLITIDFDPEDFEGKTPLIYTYNSEDGWTALETTIDWENGRATAYTTHFSLYALFGDDAEEIVEEILQDPASASVTEEETESVEDETSDTPGFTALAGIVFVLLSFFARRK
ncbi:right-handed parallel beta-helix repeat-containing protein [Methanolobus sediminis]|uniref:Right-handed parallel beta-helix repeat-containing protein n=1 Tax=Methanolobus sediminis TaxID=3072978 RepID=A0AA51UKP0_9EURY|nr:right-handed parallel beta-helix repeat-containing protein [Methanolobus sediminis]WMW25326.1 right-handed parallel beta-helix repeat-containing protein [Methanolobus sediminis]